LNQLCSYRIGASDRGAFCTTVGAIERSGQPTLQHLNNYNSYNPGAVALRYNICLLTETLSTVITGHYYLTGGQYSYIIDSK